jgi:dipeptidyl aminopeptidase/acylaminoacyl peptidase
VDLDLANDVWRISLDGDGQPQRLTDTTARFSHPVWSADGRRLACLRTPTPLDEPRHTRVAVLEVASGDQAGAGFGVVYCNPRGSSGYSEAWGRAIRWPEAKVDPGSGWGGVDFEDVMAGVAEAERRFPWIDPDRLGVLGGSHGGYLTSWIIGHSDRFRAACSERSCNDLLSLEQTSDIASSFRAVVGRSHLEAPELILDWFRERLA